MKWLREKLKGWKTRIVSLALMLIGLLEVIDPAMLIQILGADAKGYVTIGFAVSFFILRQITTTPAGHSDD